MKYIVVDDKKFAEKDVYMICINKICTQKKQNEYLISIFATTGAYHFHPMKTIDEAHSAIKNIQGTFVRNKRDNFVFLNDSFALNLDHVKDFVATTSEPGQYELNVTFNNGHKFVLYHGTNKKYVADLYASYREQFVEYTGEEIVK